jgi:hypothetical protein
MNTKIELSNLSTYFYKLGFKKGVDYSIDIDNGIIELNIDKLYCISILCENKTFEVFKTNVGAKVNSQGVYVTDGELHSYKTFKSLKCALEFALNIKSTNIFPKPELIY